jgi:aminoglycoside/choline kinase family phosphotransferase
MASQILTDPMFAMSRVTARHLEVPENALSITKLAGDASTRSYFRVEAAGSSVIVAHYPEPFNENERAVDALARAELSNPSARLTFANHPSAHIEATELFIRAGLPVPRIFEVSGADGLMLIEDAGDLKLQDWLSNHTNGEAKDAYTHALELIIKIQDATELALVADSIFAHLAFDEAKLRWELGYFFANYFNRYLHMRLDAAQSNAVQADFKEMSSELAVRPRVLTHRDYHARNLMMASGKMFIIDHQDARMGPASYDLVSLLSDPYTNLSGDAVAGLVERFIAMKAESRFPIIDIDEFKNELELMTVQRMLKAVGTYASQAAAGNPAYLEYIEPALQRAVSAMEKLGRFDATRGLLMVNLEP